MEWKKRSVLASAAIGSLLAAGLSGAAMAQSGGEITLTFALNPTCEFGQGSSMAPCEMDQSGAVPTLTFSNPQRLSGALDGIAVLNGTYVVDPAEGTFQTAGTSFFAGEVQGCGSGTLYLDYAGAGTANEDGSNTFESDVYTIVPGGTLEATGSWVQTGVDEPNGDGSLHNTYEATIECAAG